MISMSALRSGIRGDWVVIDARGRVVEIDPPSGVGPAVMLVSEVVDAVKTVEHEVVAGSVDRDELWSLRGIALHRIVLGQLGDGVLALDEMIARVRDAGFNWEVSRTSDL